MADRMAGIHIQGQNLLETVALIRRADEAGGGIGLAHLRRLRPG